VAVNKVDAGGRRPRLSREIILKAALDQADEGGVSSLSMRKLGARLGVEAMSLYHHLPNKQAILAGVVDAALDELIVSDGEDWQAAVVAYARGLGGALHRRPWLTTLLASQAEPGSAAQRQQQALCSLLQRAGFPPEPATHAFALLQAYVAGFALRALPGDDAAFEWGLELLVDGLEVRRFLAGRGVR
jgi:AcrR family transcriptional regulator